MEHLEVHSWEAVPTCEAELEPGSAWEEERTWEEQLSVQGDLWQGQEARRKAWDHQCQVWEDQHWLAEN